MPRSKSRKSEETRSRLLRAAAAEFAACGFHDAKVSRIVAEAGLAQGAFYVYFESKEAIWVELVAAFRTRLREVGNGGALVTPLAPAAVAGQVEANLRALFRFLAADPHLTRIGLLLDPEADEVMAEVRAMVERNLWANQAAGHVRPDLPVAMAAEALVGLVERVTRRWLLGGGGDPDILAADAAKLLMHGILVQGR